MAKFGLKLGVGEKALASAARDLWAERRYDFLELYVPLDAKASDAENWTWYDGVLVLHAPHSAGGFNFARRDMRKSNFRCLEMMDGLRRSLSPEMAVFHPGIEGDAGETVRQIAGLRAEFPALHRAMLLENKPRLGLNGETCLGASPREIRDILEATGCGFCLDARHAVAYAAWADVDWRNAIGEFAALGPKLWHAADGKLSDQVDSHDHFGEGDVPWAQMACFWNEDTPVTIECRKARDKQLRDFLIDLRRLREIVVGAL